MFAAQIFRSGSRNVAVLFVRPSSTDSAAPKSFDDVARVPPPRRSAALSSFKQGTGGRSSFSGAVATVFGATGFTGRYICNRLGKCGSQIIIPYRGDPYDARDLRLSGDLGQVLFFPYHLYDEDAIRKVVKHSNVVINNIGTLYETKKFPFEYTHVEAARNIARISREVGVSKLIHVSAMNASLEPEEHLIPGGSRFLKTKALGEIAVREEFPEAIIIRPATIFGNEDHFVHIYMSAWRRWFFHKIDLWHRGEDTFVMPIHASDFATGLTNAVFDPTADGQTYEFVGPHCYNFGELIEWMFDFCHRGKNYKNFHRLGFGPMTTTRTNINELMIKLWRGLSIQWNWEYLEHVECTSDVLTGVPTAEDLGVTNMKDFERFGTSALELFDHFGYYTAKLNELPRPGPMNKYPPLRKPAVAAGEPVYGRMAQTAFS